MMKFYRILIHFFVLVPVVALAIEQDSICLVGKLSNAPEVGWDKLKSDQWKGIYAKAGYVIDEVKDDSVGTFYVVYHPKEFGKSLYSGLSKLYDRMVKSSEKDGGVYRHEFDTLSDEEKEVVVGYFRQMPGVPAALMSGGGEFALEAKVNLECEGPVGKFDLTVETPDARRLKPAVVPTWKPIEQPSYTTAFLTPRNNTVEATFMRNLSVDTATGILLSGLSVKHVSGEVKKWRAVALDSYTGLVADFYKNWSEEMALSKIDPGTQFKDLNDAQKLKLRQMASYNQMYKVNDRGEVERDFLELATLRAKGVQFFVMARVSLEGKMTGVGFQIGPP